MIAFGSNLILFSDKSCGMIESVDTVLSWKRWYKRAIEQSAKQIFGAERWLTGYPQPVFLDRACKQSIPIELPAPNCWHVHRIVVAIGARARCAIGRDHVSNANRNDMRQFASEHRPFEIGWIDQSKRFVHVLDEFTLRTLLGELDTITDFVDYLSRKESLIRSSKLKFAADEEELLWEYLRKSKKTDSRNFDLTATLHICAGNWHQWKENSLYTAMKDADKGSRAFWDHRIDVFTERVLASELLPGSTGAMHDIERCLRIMASEPRIIRRAITRAFVDRLFYSAKNLRTWRMMFSPQNPETGYVFLFFRQTEHVEFEKYREERKMWLTSLIMIYATHNRHLRNLVGIATEAGPDSARRTYELSLCAPKNGGPTLENIRGLQDLLGIKAEDINANYAIELEFAPR
jgi:hypothetical protein